MAGDSFPDIIKQWNGIKSKGPSAVNPDELIAFQDALYEALRLDVDQTEFHKALRDSRVLPTLCEWYPSAPLHHACAIASLMSLFGAHEDFLADAADCKLVSVALARGFAHPDNIYDVNAGLKIALEVSSNSDNQYLKTLKSMNIFTLLENSCTILLAGPSRDQKNEANHESINPSDFPEKMKPSACPPTPLPTNEYRLHLWDCTLRLICGFIALDPAFFYPSSRVPSLFLTTLLAGAGSLEKVSRVARTACASLIVAVIRKKHCPALQAWLLSPSHAPYYAVIAALDMPMLPQLMNTMLVQGVHRAPRTEKFPVARNGLFSSSVVRAHFNSKFVASNPENGLAFVAITSLALHRDHEAAVQALIDADILGNITNVMPPLDNADALGQATALFSSIVESFYSSANPLACAAIAASRLSFVTFALTVQSLLVAQGLHTSLPGTIVGFTLDVVIDKTYRIMRRDAALLSGQRRADAALAAATDAEAAGLPRPAVGKGEVDWAAIAVGPGGAKGAAWRRNVVKKVTEVYVNEGNLLCSLSEILAARATGNVAGKEEPFLSLDEEVGKKSPVVAAVIEKICGFIIEMCPCVSAIATMQGALPYAVWPSPQKAGGKGKQK